MRYKAVVAYDGTDYNGWQKQINGVGIQTVIEKALEKMLGHACEAVASGRTDGGVHALGQVFHFDSEKKMKGERMKMALNSLLPGTIRIQSREPVSDQFHARFDAVSKRYDYLVGDCGNNPFAVRFMAPVREKLDVLKMQECAQVLVGTHDFTSFTSAKIDQRKSRVRTIDAILICEEKNGIRMIFEGDGFLRYQVRMMAGTLLEVGKGKLTKADVEVMLEGKDKHLCRYKAEAQGLYLVRVDYEKDDCREAILRFLMEESQERDIRKWWGHKR